MDFHNNQKLGSKTLLPKVSRLLLEVERHNDARSSKRGAVSKKSSIVSCSFFKKNCVYYKRSQFAKNVIEYLGILLVNLFQIICC